MEKNLVILCGSSKYTKKYYLNDAFKALPEGIQEDLKIICVLFTEEVGGTMQLIFDADGNLTIQTSAEEEDFLYDEIGAALKVKELQRSRKELFESLEMYYRVVILGQAYEEDEDASDD